MRKNSVPSGCVQSGQGQNLGQIWVRQVHLAALPKIWLTFLSLYTILKRGGGTFCDNFSGIGSSINSIFSHHQVQRIYKLDHIILNSTILPPLIVSHRGHIAIVDYSDMGLSSLLLWLQLYCCCYTITTLTQNQFKMEQLC